MITYLEGRLLAKAEDRIVVLVGGVGYEVLLPAIARAGFRGRRAGEEGEIIRLYTFYHQTERQPKPLLIGFESELEREFFELLITVEEIGPAAAARAMTRSVSSIARAIENKDAQFLRQLDGVGPRKAEKIIATLNGRVGKFALLPDTGEPPTKEEIDFAKEVIGVLVKQLGHRQSEAQRLVQEALARRAGIDSAEALFDEVYRGEARSSSD